VSSVLVVILWIYVALRVVVIGWEMLIRERTLALGVVVEI
jgi:hypothetical protein